MDFSIPSPGPFGLINGDAAEPLETTAGIAPLDRDELVRYSRQIGERREAWREAHLQDLRRVYPRR